MTIYFQGSEMESLWYNPGYPQPVESTSGREVAWSRAAAYPNNTGNYIEADAGQELTEFWLHGFIGIGDATNPNSTPIFRFYDGADAEMLRIQVAGGTIASMLYWDGTAWVALSPATFLYGRGIYYRFDFRILMGDGATTPDRVEVWIDELLVIVREEIGFLKANFNGTRYYRGWHANRGSTHSQIIISDESMLNWHSLTVPPTGEGTDATDGVGAYTTVNELVTNNANFVAFSAAGQKRSFVSTARTLSEEIRGVTVAGRLRKADESSPDTVRPYLIVGVTRYYGDNKTLTVGYLNFRHTWDLNPATAAAWTPGEVNDASLEWGWEVVA